MAEASLDSRLRSCFKFVYRYIHEFYWYLPKRIKHFVCKCRDRLFTVVNTPPNLYNSEPNGALLELLYGMRQLLSDACASRHSRRDSLPVASRLDHRCPPPLRFHHAGMAIARRTTTPASGTVRSARRIHVFVALRTVPFFFFFHGCLTFSFKFPSRTRTCSHQE